jgi:hypothetical protein
MNPEELTEGLELIMRAAYTTMKDMDNQEKAEVLESLRRSLAFHLTVVMASAGVVKKACWMEDDDDFDEEDF